MTRKELEDFIKSLPNTKLDFPFGEEVAVYKVFISDKTLESLDNTEVSIDSTHGTSKMYALVSEDKQPISISLKCDPVLAKFLREKYESVMEGYHLNKKHWITLLLTGQLSDQDVQDLILHSYNLVIGNKDPKPVFD